MSRYRSSLGRARAAVLSVSLVASLGVVGGVTATVVSTPVAASAASVIGGKITRSEVLERAQSWVDRKLTYASGSSTHGPGGDGDYNRDCSGLVSMAWHLKDKQWTGSFPDSGLWTALASLNDLKPGDTVHRDGHMELFVGWIKASDHTKGAYIYSFNQTGETVRNPYE